MDGLCYGNHVLYGFASPTLLPQTDLFANFSKFITIKDQFSNGYPNFESFPRVVQQYYSYCTKFCIENGFGICNENEEDIELLDCNDNSDGFFSSFYTEINEVDKEIMDQGKHTYHSSNTKLFLNCGNLWYHTIHVVLGAITHNSCGAINLLNFASVYEFLDSVDVGFLAKIYRTISYQICNLMGGRRKSLMPWGLDQIFIENIVQKITKTIQKDCISCFEDLSNASTMKWMKFINIYYATHGQHIFDGFEEVYYGQSTTDDTITSEDEDGFESNNNEGIDIISKKFEDVSFLFYIY